jgi:DNA (cytosine-5)-methyltransferase 1
MKHLGSVTEVNGGKVEPVDVITFGSPCQDLSVAGKRAGLKHTENGDEETTRSGLFMEAVRIIKEMREKTNGVYPRFALWENVPGAFSSNKGEDFRTVLEELIKIVEPSAVMPTVPKNGWPYSDHYCGDGWSIAYRTLDSQHWGVPQRRKRIYLVLDLGGQCAGKVLFEREGLRGYFEKGRTPWQAVTRDAESGSGTADCEGERNSVIPYTLKIRSGCEGGGKGALIQTDKSATLSTLNDQYLFQPMSVREENWEESNVRNTLRAGESKSSHCVVEQLVLEPVAVDGYNQTISDKPGSLRAGKSDGDHVGMVIQSVVDAHILDDQGGSQISVRSDGKCPTLRAEAHGNVPAVMEPIAVATQQGGAEITQNGVCPTITAAAGMSGNNQPWICYRESAGFCPEQSAKTRGIGYEEEQSPTLRAGVTPAVVCKCYDARGNGDGSIAPTITGDHNNRVTDYTSLICYGIGNGQANQSYSEEVVGALNCMHDQQAVCYRQGGFAEYIEGEVGTLRAAGGDFGGGSENLIRVRYIVRRLTPTECARLQGFPDGWGHPDRKDDFTEDEYRFWLNVRNTHAEINGKAVKDYTKEQMLTWYNKLHTDSSEYKMWGNGIALPTALYVMQGIEDVFK